MSKKDWTGVSLTCDLGTKAIYASVCQLLEQYKQELQKLPAVCEWHLSNTKLQRHLVADAPACSDIISFCSRPLCVR